MTSNSSSSTSRMLSFLVVATTLMGSPSQDCRSNGRTVRRPRESEGRLPVSGHQRRSRRPPRLSTIFLTKASPMPAPSTRSRGASVWKTPKIRSRYWGRDARPVVGDGEMPSAVLDLASVDGDPCNLVATVLHGIVDEVCQHLLEPQLVGSGAPSWGESQRSPPGAGPTQSTTSASSLATSTSSSLVDGRFARLKASRPSINASIRCHPAPEAVELFDGGRSGAIAQILFNPVR